MKKSFLTENTTLVTLFYMCTFIACSLLFLFLQPKVSALLSQSKREKMLKNFITNVQTSQGVHGQDYWEFREFYSPGNFIFDRNGIKKINIPPDTLPFLSFDQFQPYLYFSSPYLSSVDSLIDEKDLQKLISPTMPEGSTILFKSNTALLFQKINITYLLFVLPYEEMKKTNGFFNYDGQDKTLLRNKNWYNVTIIRKE